MKEVAIRSMAKFREIWKNIYIEVTLICLSSLLGLEVLSLAVGGYSIKVYFSYLSDIRLVILNITPVILFTMLMYAIAGQAWISLLLSSLITILISLCNYYKLIFRDDPLLFEDIALIREATKMSSSYVLFVDLKVGLALITGAVITVLMYGISDKKKAASKERVAILAVILVLGWIGWPIYQDNERYQAFNNYEELNQWSGTERIYQGVFGTRLYIAYPSIKRLSQMDMTERKRKNCLQRMTMTFLNKKELMS